MVPLNLNANADAESAGQGSGSAVLLVGGEENKEKPDHTNFDYSVAVAREIAILQVS